MKQLSKPNTNLHKSINLNEFRKLGFLQEANRQFFHPLGLALSVNLNEITGDEIEIGDIWDSREDPEGIIFDNLDGPENKTKANYVKKLATMKAKARMKMLGYVIQPIGKTKKRSKEAKHG